MNGNARLYRKLEATANCFSVTAVSASLLILFYFFYVYGWTHSRQFNNGYAMALYYLVPAGVGAAFLVSLTQKAAFRINCMLATLSILATAYAGECIVRVIGAPIRYPAMHQVDVSDDKPKAAEKFAKKYGVRIDYRSSAQVIADLKKSGIAAVPIVTPVNDLFIKEPDGSIKSALNTRGQELIPLGGISRRRTVMCNEGGQWVSYDSDEHGFSNPEGIWSYGNIDIVALGDSFAQGYCVEPEKSFVGLIRQQIAGTLNLGMAGEGPLLMLASLREYGELFKPKIVLWFYFEGNDLDDLQSGESVIDEHFLLNYLNSGFTQHLITRQDEIDKAIMDDTPRRIALSEHRKLMAKANSGKVLPVLLDFAKLGALRTRLHLVGGNYTNEVDIQRRLAGPTLELFARILARARDDIAAWKGQIYFVYLPDWSRYAGGSSSPINDLRSRVIEIARTLGIPVIDIEPAFQAHSDPLSLFPFRYPGHYNEAGNRIVAAEVLRVITDRTNSQSHDSTSLLTHTGRR
jgi:hypothetical protein